jgi:acid phosphatase class B
MVLKDVRAKVEQTWTTTKKILAALSVWGLIFSIVTIARLGVAFTYDDVLVNSLAAHEKAENHVQQLRSPEYWKIVNNAYDLESPKILPYTLACLFRAFGFRVMIMAERAGSGGEALKKEWRHIAPRSFIFVPDPQELHMYLQDERVVLFFSDGDRELLQAKRVGVYGVRVRRSKKSINVGEYNPGQLGEFVIPLSQF